MLYIFLTALKTVLVADTEGTNSQDSSIFQKFWKWISKLEYFVFQKMYRYETMKHV